MFSLKLPHQGDSNEYTECTSFNIKKSMLNCPKSAAMGFFSWNEFETAVINEPSVFEPLKFCICTACSKKVEKQSPGIETAILYEISSVVF